MGAREDKSPIGIVGGSGLYDIADIEIDNSVKLETPYGDPSDEYVIGFLQGVKVIFLNRHGPGHKITAPGVNYRANIYGFKALGAQILIGVSAVGSMREELAPMDIVIPDQMIDLTKSRESSFFLDTPAIHGGMADPFCNDLGAALAECAESVGANVTLGGTYLCIEGPAFSTRAESKLYRTWGVDVIGMTAATEAKLCREAEVCYSSISLVTDYDCWKEGAEDVTLDMIIGYVQKNAEMAGRIIGQAISRVPDLASCACRSALAPAIATSHEQIPDVTRRRLRVLLEKYLPVKD
jgi:5'-methylthioadenosine phosphorylase